MSVRVHRQRYWRTVTRVVTRKHRQRYWHVRSDGIRQRYWHTVSRRVEVTHRQRYWRKVEVPVKPKGEWVEFTYSFGYREPGVSDRYEEYDVTITKWVPEGEKDMWKIWEKYQSEAAKFFEENVPAEERDFDWFYDQKKRLPRRRGGWERVANKIVQTTLDDKGKAATWGRRLSSVSKAGWRARKRR